MNKILNVENAQIVTATIAVMAMTIDRRQVEGAGPEQIQGGAAEGTHPSTCPRCYGEGCDHCDWLLDDQPEEPGP